MTLFTDIQREEAIAICEELVRANRAEIIADCLRQGATLSDVRRLLAAEAALVSVPAPRRLDTDTELAKAAAARFAVQSKGRPPSV